MSDEADTGPLAIEYALIDCSEMETEQELYWALLANVELPVAPAAAFADAVRYIMRRLGPPKA